MENKWRKIIIIVILVIFVVMILIALLVGFKGLKQFFLGLLIAFLILSILFGLLYTFWLIFIKKEFKDIPYTYKKKVIASTKLMKQAMLGDLYLSGDYKHNRIMLGKFYYMRIPLPKQTRVERKDKNDNPIFNPITKEQVYDEKTEQVEVDAFIVSKQGFFDKLFGEPMVLLVKPEDHDFSAIFNDVTIKGFNLIPLDNNFYTINSRSLDIDITKGITTLYLREVVHEVMRDLDRMVKQAMNLDSSFTKDKARQNEFEIPKLSNLTGGGGNQNG